MTMAIRASQIGQICKRKRGYRYAYLRGLHLCNFQVMTTKYQNGSLNSCWFQVVVLRSLLDASVDHFRNVLGGILGRRRLTDSFFPIPNFSQYMLSQTEPIKPTKVFCLSRGSTWCRSIAPKLSQRSRSKR